MSCVCQLLNKRIYDDDDDDDCTANYTISVDFLFHFAVNLTVQQTVAFLTAKALLFHFTK